MTQLPPHERPDRQACPLDYASPKVDRPDGGAGAGDQFTRSVAGLCIGALFAIVGLFVGAFAVIGIARAVDIGGRPRLLIVMAIAVSSLGILVQTMRYARPLKNFLLGMLIGVGLVFLAIGICSATYRL